MCDLCWGTYPDAGNNEIPARGDVVEEWIERQRDSEVKGSDRWDVLNDLLNLYRDHADTGTELGSEVMGPYSSEEFE